MMEVVKSTNVARLSILFFLILLSQSKSLLAQQEDFVSIQCCAPSSFIDPITKIRWISDTHLQNNGKCENISNPEGNDNKLARFFHNGSSDKWCYKLDTVNGQNYLVRGKFVRGNQTPVNTSFDVSLGATLVGRVSSSVEFLELEAIFGANNDNMEFCMVRRTGDPYLSKLELRLLGDSDYSEREQSSILKVVIRSDVGNTKGLIRYPYDLGDRIWNINVSQIENATPESNLNMDVIGANTTVPITVLQTAVTNAESLDFFHDGLGVNDADYLIYLYFLELNATVGRGQRAFDIYVNGKVQPGIFDMLGHGNTSNYKEVVLKVKTNRFLNVSLIKVNGSEFGPMLNAYEIFEVQKWVEGTLQKDVDIIVKLRDELLVENQGNEVLASWSGDSCLPIAWHGIRCHSSDNGYMVITHLDLSSIGLQGPLPPVITELPHLTQLNFSLNQFQGTIPPFPLYSVLMSMDVRHNDLNGPIPESLASLPHLSKLYFGCTPHFGKIHHSKLLNRANLTTDSGTCNPTPHPRTGRYVVIGSVAAGSLLFTVAVGGMLICIYRRRLLRKLDDEDLRVTHSRYVVIGSVAAGSLLFTVAVGGMLICIYRRRLLRKLDDEDLRVTHSAVFSIASIDDFGFKSISVQAFTLDCIEIATQKYNTLIGEGGFGSVYRGTLPDGQEVAVKVRSATSTQGTREFENELNLLSAMWHENLVPLIGYCCDFDQQILVYPFMSNGSLQDRLYGEASKRKVLDWPTRLSIALGAARGLLYLHTFAGRCIIHRDVKSSNILLDHRMTARVADFGFSKYAPQEDDSNASLEVRGTAGYLDPEYYSTQHLSAKSDVFSFGVVLLEIISGREPLDIHRPRNEWSLVEWAKPLVTDSRIEEIIDPNIKARYAETMWRVVEVALMCIEPFSAYRPCMADIVRELEDALIIENNASEYMKSIDSIGGSNRYSSIDKKLGSSKRYSSIEKKLAMTPTPTEPSPIISQALAPPQPR